MVGNDRQRLDRGTGQLAADDALGPQLGRQIGRRAKRPAAGQPHQTWNVFKKNKDGMGVVSSDIKQPPVGADFVMPPGTAITFEFGNDAVPVVTM